jgi:hypothetical protein
LSTIDTVKKATNRTNSVVVGEINDLAGTLNSFETDEAITATPTQYITLTSSTGEDVHRFELEEVVYNINPTAAVTYQLWLLEASNADDVEQTTDVVFFSPAAQADTITYRYTKAGYSASVAGSTAEVAQYKLPVTVELENPNRLWYLTDWSGAPGNSPGILKVRGRLLK